MTILVVDDEPVVAALIAEAVRMQGHQAVTANGEDEALSLLASAFPDAMFLDLEMPAQGGLQLLRRIRASRPDLPVVLFAGAANTATLANARLLGVTDVVEKPIALAHLSETLRRLERR